MAKTKEEPTKECRATISQAAHDNIDLVKAEQLLKGNKMTREETISFMLENFKSK